MKCVKWYDKFWDSFVHSAQKHCGHITFVEKCVPSRDSEIQKWKRTPTHSPPTQTNCPWHNKHSLKLCQFEFRKLVDKTERDREREWRFMCRIIYLAASESEWCVLRGRWSVDIMYSCCDCCIIWWRTSVHGWQQLSPVQVFTSYNIFCRMCSHYEIWNIHAEPIGRRLKD